MAMDVEASGQEGADEKHVAVEEMRGQGGAADQSTVEAMHAHVMHCMHGLHVTMCMVHGTHDSQLHVCLTVDYCCCS